MNAYLFPGLIAVAVVLYLLWGLFERSRIKRAHRVHLDVSALGDDAVPVSIHPAIDLDRCIGSGACVQACPEHDVIGVISGRAVLLNPLACIGHGACLSACPVDAIKLVFGTAKRGLELPKLDAHFQTTQPGIYVAGELGGMGLIRNAVEQGRQVSQAVAGSGRRGGATALDALVVGAGPAGISCTLGLVEAGLKVHLVDQSEFGGTIVHYPRSKVVMTGELDFPAYGKVKKRTMSKEQLVELWNDIKDKSSLPVETGIQVSAIEPDPAGGWLVRAGGGWERRAASVVLALGRRGSPRELGIPGEESSKVHYRLLEPEPFKGKRVLIVGGGNSAAECALALADYKECAEVAISYRRPQFARLRSQVAERITKEIAEGRVRGLLGTQMVGIERREVVLKGERGLMRIPNDAVIIQIGGSSPNELLASFGVETVEKRGEA